MPSLFRQTPDSDAAPEPLELALRFCKEPTAAMRRLMDYDVAFFHWPLLGILGAASALPLLGLVALLGGLAFLAVPAVIGMTLASVYGFAGLLWVTGIPLKGEATYRQLVAATLWALVPLVPAGILGFVPLVGEIASLVALLYSASLLVSTVAEAQGFSKGMSMVNQTLAVLIFGVILAILLYQPVMSLIQQLQQQAQLFQ